MTNQFATLVGVSPVAAQVRFDDGKTRTFSISHGEYDRLRGMDGEYISLQRLSRLTSGYGPLAA